MITMSILDTGSAQQLLGNPMVRVLMSLFPMQMTTWKLDGGVVTRDGIVWEFEQLFEI